MRILFADSLDDAAVERLRAGGEECVVRPELIAADLPDHVAGFDILVVRSTEVTAAAIDAGTELGLIVRAGAGTNTIDCQRAAERGVYVCNVPGRNAVAVAELAVGLMLAIDRHIASAAADLRAGRWGQEGLQPVPGPARRHPGDHRDGRHRLGGGPAGRGPGAAGDGRGQAPPPPGAPADGGHRSGNRPGSDRPAGRQRHRVAARARRSLHRGPGRRRLPGRHEARRGC